MIKQPFKIPSMLAITMISPAILVGITTLCWLVVFGAPSIKKTQDAPICPPLPMSFKESDLIGTWVGRYFGDIDKLIIRADGTYKQIFSSDSLHFESDWQKWNIEYDPHGYIRLHLAEMRRCDDFDICNTQGGGLPTGEVAINPCYPEYVNYTNEVILFVTGYASDVPRGIVFRHARLAGSDWNSGFQLEK